MNCPYCSHDKSRVTDKRGSPEGVRRRRECLKCKKRFTTYEKISKSEMFVLKKDGRREEFSRDKVKRGFERAFEKRPVSEEKIENLVSEIEDLIRRKGIKEIPSSMIGEIIMKKIKKTDNVAYIRFVSVYREFKDPKEFTKEVRELNGN